MQPQVTVIASQLAFPEGPIAMPDGSIVLVEIKTGRLTRLRDGGRETVAELGGGPNGAAIGPDGYCYVCNNGGLSGPSAMARHTLANNRRSMPAVAFKK